MELEPDQVKPVITRMKRAHGHLGSVIRMMEDGADCEDVLTQLAAVNKALSRAGYAVVATGLQQCLAAADGEVDGVDVAKMEKLFLSLACVRRDRRAADTVATIVLPTVWPAGPPMW